MAGSCSLANKVLSVPVADLSKTKRRFVERFGIEDAGTGVINVASPLIAQLGKNYTEGANELLSGDDLLSAACEKVIGIQRDLGGRLVYLECEDEPKFVSFYERNGFRRILADDDGRADGLLRLIEVYRFFRHGELR